MKLIYLMKINLRINNLVNNKMCKLNPEINLIQYLNMKSKLWQFNVLHGYIKLYLNV